jgi:hypothetical protein
MNKMMNKKIMNVLNTQLSLLITWCLLEVDAKNFLKSHKSLKGKKKMKIMRIWKLCLNKNEKTMCLKNMKK